jgi:hypothetical protein
MEADSEMSKKPARNWLRSVVVGSLLLAGGVYFTLEATGVFCSGPCAVMRCTAQRPCVWNRVNYTAGARCHPKQEGLVCDPGIIFDCHCLTAIVQGANPPALACSCI